MIHTFFIFQDERTVADDEIVAILTFDCLSDSEFSILSEVDDIKQAGPITFKKATELVDLNSAPWGCSSIS